jgi:hypothetical protein
MQSSRATRGEIEEVCLSEPRVLHPADGSRIHRLWKQPPTRHIVRSAHDVPSLPAKGHKRGRDKKERASFARLGREGCASEIREVCFHLAALADACGEGSKPQASGEGALGESNARRFPLTPTLSAQAGRGRSDRDHLAV